MPELTESADAVIERARSLFEVPDFESIIRLVGLPEVRDEPDAIFLLALAQEGAGEAELALAAARRLVASGDGRGPAALAERLWNDGRIEESLHWFDLAVAGGDVEAELNFARCLLWLDRRDDAVGHLRSLLTGGSSIGDEAAGLLGSVMAAEDDFSAQTLSLLERGQDREADAKAWLGVVGLRMGQRRRALTLLESALSANSMQASVRLGNFYLEVGRLRDAERAYRVGVDGDDKFAMFNLGKMIYENYSRRRRESLHLIKTAAQSGDTMAKAWLRWR